MRNSCLITAFCTFAAGLPGCALVGARSANNAPPSGQGITFVADGSGDLRQVADTLGNVMGDSHAPMGVERVQWSHAKGAVFPDLYDSDNHQAQGKTLAKQVLAYRQANPTCRICLLGYSSGAAVTLAATQQLPQGTVDRIVLLSPCVAAKHDLRPALRCSREGIDSFNSEWDTICLVLYAMGTGDGAGQAVAGRSGFVAVGDTAEDQQLYRGLRQHTWQGAEAWSGHDGGHFGCFKREFLGKQVLPLLVGQQ